MFPDYSVSYVPGLYRLWANVRCSTQAICGLCPPNPTLLSQTNRGIGEDCQGN